MIAQLYLEYAQDTCPIMMLVHASALVVGIHDHSTFGIGGPNKNTSRIQVL